jgi:UDP-N-acetylglucosamine diphosphorylase / glucose-1-phosphate thymidylyltransferase / UDP-N-acetylgalactosamine diphosphorylase / glucosamine-1-phosphate N-acetyltransferase / galactosamine-1-phosphate N-acetyltransferase
MNCILFEDGTHDNFYPIAQTRPLWDLRCGAFTMAERIRAVVSDGNISYRVRPHFAEVCRERNESLFGSPADEALLAVNALLVTHSLSLPENTVVAAGTRVAAAHLSASYVKAHAQELSSPEYDFAGLVSSKELTVIQLPKDWILPRYIWDLVLKNGDVLRRDYALVDKRDSKTASYSVTLCGNVDQIYIEDSVKIDPFVYIDATKGPVIIKKGCEINPFTRIEGPCFIGEQTIVTGAKIREGCSFGPVCRVGGEVEDSIFQGYSNKYHDGFIGHAYIGEWVNLGAMTTNSDLKNNYTNVCCELPSGTVDTGSSKAGCVIGDFSKTSIGTLINTGSIIGTGAMTVFSGRMTPSLTPDFCRFIKNELRDTGSAAECIETNSIACSRRDKTLTPAMRKLLTHIYASTAEFRQKKVRTWNAAQK